MASQKYANLAQGTLSVAYVVGDTSLVLNSGQGALFPSTGNFIVGLGDTASANPDFFLNCTARSTDTLTVDAAAQEGTTRVNKAIGKFVTQVITAGVFDAIRSDISQVGTYANLPATGMKAGDCYKCTDRPYEFVYTGSLWQAFYQGWPVTPPPTFTWRNQGSATVVNDAGTEYLLAPPASGNNFKGREITAPATPYTITAVMQRHTYNLASSNNGLYFTDGTKLVIFYYGLAQFGVNKYSNVTTYLGTVVTAAIDAPLSPMVLRITDDGTNHIFKWSLDGINFHTFLTQSRTLYLSSPITAVGYFAESNNATYPAATKLIDWKQS